MTNKLLTIGMATYDDYDGTYFTIQSLRMHHEICKSNDVEFIILDNNPNGSHGMELKKSVSNWMKNVKYIEKNDVCSSCNFGAEDVCDTHKEELTNGVL